MRLFNFGRKNVEKEEPVTFSAPAVEAVESNDETTSVKPIAEQVANKAEKPLSISYATGWPIDVIYGYLHKNFEGKGFEDAMVKNDLSFRDMNMNIIKSKILMVFREISLNYIVKKQNLQIRIDNCNAAGLLTIVAELDKTMLLIDTHISELKQLEMEFNQAPNMSVPLQSYNCGFLRGIATISLEGANNHMEGVINELKPIKQAIA